MKKSVRNQNLKSESTLPSTEKTKVLLCAYIPEDTTPDGIKAPEAVSERAKFWSNLSRLYRQQRQVLSLSLSLSLER